MPTANEDIFDAALSHGVGLERYKAQVIRQMMEFLNETEDALIEQLNRRLGTIIANGGYEDISATEDRINELLRMIGKIRQEAYGSMDNFLSDQLKEFGQKEVDWQTALIEHAVPVELGLSQPTAELLNELIFSKPFNGVVLKDWAEKAAEADLNRIESTVKHGIVQGQTTDEIVRDVIGTRSSGYADGVLEVSRRGTEALVRTAINHVSNEARMATYEANDDIISKYRWVSTLDGRTTAICRSRDGQDYAIGHGPRPPAHWNCRSTTIPIIDGIAIVADRPSITDTRGRKEREVDFREEAKSRAGDRWKGMSRDERNAAIDRQRKAWAKENIGSNPPETTYQQWLSSKSASFQDEVLGPTRGKLFRDGGLTLDRFVDSSGKEYTLEELYKNSKAAFQAANLPKP